MPGFDEWKKFELKIAKISRIEDIAGKDKLYKLTVNLGGEERTIVAGIKASYTKEELQGKAIIIVSNLEPAKIAGIESNGMLLAVKGSDGKYKLLMPDGEAEAGTAVE